MRLGRGSCTPSMCYDVTTLVNWSMSHCSSRVCIHFCLQTFLLGSRQHSGVRSRERRGGFLAADALLRSVRPGFHDWAVLAVAISSDCSHLTSLCALLYLLDGMTWKGLGGDSWQDNMCTNCRHTGRRGQGTIRESPCPFQERKQGQVHT